MKSTSSNKKNLYALGLIFLAFAFIFGYAHYLNSNETTPPAESKPTNTNQDKNTVNVPKLFDNMDATLLASIKEKDFVQYAQTAIEKRCPFYKPDGATYRGCLSDWEQGLETKVLVEQADEVHAYCSTFTKKYADESSLEGQELFLRCAIFKLQ